MVRFVIGAGLGIVGTGFLLAFRHVAGEARKVLEGNGASTYEIREARETAGNAKLACAGSALVAAVGAALIATSCFYSQDVRYPDEITQKYAEAQAAEVARQQAQNEQETAKVKAETKKIEAQGEADANAVLTQSLTPEVLSQRYIDALKEIGASGNLVVVPEGSTPMVSAK